MPELLAIPAPALRIEMQPNGISTSVRTCSWPCQAAVEVESGEPAARADATDGPGQRAIRCDAALEQVGKGAGPTGNRAAADIGSSELNLPCRMNYEPLDLVH
jgi:hypothetical protein